MQNLSDYNSSVTTATVFQNYDGEYSLHQPMANLNLNSFGNDNSMVFSNMNNSGSGGGGSLFSPLANCNPYQPQQSSFMLQPVDYWNHHQQQHQQQFIQQSQNQNQQQQQYQDSDVLNIKKHKRVFALIKGPVRNKEPFALFSIKQLNELVDDVIEKNTNIDDITQEILEIEANISWSNMAIDVKSERVRSYIEHMIGYLMRRENPKHIYLSTQQIEDVIKLSLDTWMKQQQQQKNHNHGEKKINIKEMIKECMNKVWNDIQKDDTNTTHQFRTLFLENEMLKEKITLLNKHNMELLACRCPCRCGQRQRNGKQRLKPTTYDNTNNKKNRRYNNRIGGGGGGGNNPKRQRKNQN